MEKIVIDTKEKLLEHFGKPKPDFFGISDLYMTSLEQGRRIQSRMVDNYIRFVLKITEARSDVGSLHLS